MRRQNVTTPAAWSTTQPQPAPWPAPGTTAETETPARPATFGSDVVVPFVQAAVTGALAGGIFVLVLSEVAPRLDVDLWKAWAAAALVVTFAVWLTLLGQTRRLLWAIESVTNLDINQDGATGAPQERVVIVGAERNRQAAELQAGAQRASQFARFVAGLPVKGTDLRSWERELGRDTYNDYRDALLRLGWAAWRSVGKDGTPNERQGWELALSADDILRRIS